jgi:twitching motility protein PilT
VALSLPLVESLLTAIVRADGDALVMHVGEKPYVVSAAGSVELSSRSLQLDSLSGLLAQLLPTDEQRTLEEFGAIEHELTSPSKLTDRFKLVAARGGDDIWIEIRRYRTASVQSAAAFETGSADPAPADSRADAPAPAGEKRPRPQPVWHQSTEPVPGVVVSMPRTVRAEPGPPTAPRGTGLDRLIRLAASRGASALYLVAGTRPLIRVDGEFTSLDGEAALGSSEVEALLLDLAPEPSRDALKSGILTEWICDVPEAGRVRCLSFRDHRGPGGMFRMIPARALSAEQLGLSKEIQALSSQPDGLVVVTGPRRSGKSTLVSAFVDLVNRTRSDHVITIESELKFVHESRRAFVSQREVRGDTEEWLAAVRAAVREDPDVLVLEDLRSAEIVLAAVDAADAGRLVIGSVAAPSTSAAIDRLIEQCPPERRAHVQQALARTLRGVVAQALLRKTGGGRLAARELLLNTPPVANLIAEGKTHQLPLALDSGRRHGMVPLNDALAAFVQSGATDAREAYRKAFDREGLLNLLKRAGVDTSFVERLA